MAYDVSNPDSRHHWHSRIEPATESACMSGNRYMEGREGQHTSQNRSSMMTLLCACVSVCVQLPEARSHTCKVTQG